MNSKRINDAVRLTIGLVGAMVALNFWNGGPCQAQPANLSPGLTEVVRLTKAQMSDDVIINYIGNSGQTYHLSADDLLYLKDQGVSQPVITALLQPKAPAVAVSTPAAVPVSTAPPVAPVAQVAVVGGAQQPPPPPDADAGDAPAPGPEVSFTYFHDQLAPFGAWVDVDGQQYWRPDMAVRANPDWRPYYDMGQWVQTDNGLFWQSEYAWGDIPFHYGRWIRHPEMGWLWAPDYTWGPSWVFWRHAEADGAVGWAPLPVGAVFVDGVFMFRGARVGLDFDFGLGEGVFTFVAFDHFGDPFFRMRGREWAYHIHGDRFHEFYHRSVIRNEFRRDEHGRFVNNGIGRERMERATHGRLEHSSFEERRPVGDRNKLASERSKETAQHDTKARGGEKGGGAGEKGGSSGEKGGSKGSSMPSKVFRPPTTSSSSRSSSSGSKGSKSK